MKILVLCFIFHLALFFPNPISTTQNTLPRRTVTQVLIFNNKEQISMDISLLRPNISHKFIYFSLSFLMPPRTPQSGPGCSSYDQNSATCIFWSIGSLSDLLLDSNLSVRYKIGAMPSNFDLKPNLHSGLSNPNYLWEIWVSILLVFHCCCYMWALHEKNHILFFPLALRGFLII